MTKAERKTILLAAQRATFRKNHSEARRLFALINILYCPIPLGGFLFTPKGN